MFYNGEPVPAIRELDSVDQSDCKKCYSQLKFYTMVNWLMAESAVLKPGATAHEVYNCHKTYPVSTSVSGLTPKINSSGGVVIELIL